MSKKRIKQYLMLLTAVGLVAVAAGGGSGTFASFNAQVTNPGNTFASGTLFLHNTNGATTCKSETGALNTIPGTGAGGTDVCATLFSNVNLQGGDTTAHLALNNAGTLAATDLKWDISGCTWGDNFAVTGSHILFGAPPACSAMWVTVQETQSNYTTNVACAAGTTTTPPACDAPDGTYSLASSAPTNLLTVGGVTAPFAAAATRYYVITIHPGVTNDNTLQNRTVTFAMDWNLEQ
ncbi:MAG TPA: SipW-dependent-type signal peptide-containing protein [Gaiellaceae bacterium]|jgi:predicted ribosomally synthesized peptide with SipW-like signal peptide